MELTVFDIQRNVQPDNYEANTGMEFAAVSVQLHNIGSDTPRPYEISDFQLQDTEGNPFGPFWPPNDQADNERQLQKA